MKKKDFFRDNRDFIKTPMMWLDAYDKALTMAAVFKRPQFPFINILVSTDDPNSYRGMMIPIGKMIKEKTYVDNIPKMMQDAKIQTGITGVALIFFSNIKIIRENLNYGTGEKETDALYFILETKDTIRRKLVVLRDFGDYRGISSTLEDESISMFNESLIKTTGYFNER